MKRCYYISNAFDGKYFVLTDNVREYVERMAAYVMNLEKSGKCNSYSFGSVEMSQKDYEAFRTGAEAAEQTRIRQVREQQLEQEEQKRRDPSIPLPTPAAAKAMSAKEKRPNPGLRLV